jgi:mannose-6-phosphate isomerase-like protein (cupin superfamily)
MNPPFNIDHADLATDLRFSDIAKHLAKLSPIDSTESFNRYCREACRIWQQKFPDGIGETEQFSHYAAQIENTNESVIRTSWGGVVITLHQHPRVEKYLVVRRAGYLALEMHKQKDEHIEIREGAGLLLQRPPEQRSLVAQVLRPNDHYHFPPGIEHCIIGTEDLLIFERSTDPKGMDQDLIFLYQPAPPMTSQSSTAS